MIHRFILIEQASWIRIYILLSLTLLEPFFSKFPNIPYRPKIIPTKKELQHFFTVLASDFSKALFLFYASSGLKKGEVLGLNTENVDFQKRMIIPNYHAWRN
jgi:integrase